MKLFAGNSNRVLAEAVARYLNIPLGKATVRRFADQEIFVEIRRTCAARTCSSSSRPPSPPMTI